jgi:carboxyvinyl-carboxyphosphonate phosphorylmutase
MGGFPEELIVPDHLAARRVRIALQGHAPFAAATQAVYQTLKALRDGEALKNLTGLATPELIARVTRNAAMKDRAGEFLGLGNR